MAIKIYSFMYQLEIILPINSVYRDNKNKITIKM